MNDPTPTARARRDEAGFTLIETLIAIIVLVFGLIAVTNLFLVAGSSNTVANQATAASDVAAQILENFKAQPWNSAQLAATTGTFHGRPAADGRHRSASGPINSWWSITDVDTRTKFFRVRSEGAGLLVAGSLARGVHHLSDLHDACPGVPVSAPRPEAWRRAMTTGDPREAGLQHGRAPGGDGHHADDQRRDLRAADRRPERVPARAGDDGPAAEHPHRHGPHQARRRRRRRRDGALRPGLHERPRRRGRRPQHDADGGRDRGDGHRLLQVLSASGQCPRRVADGGAGRARRDVELHRTAARPASRTAAPPTAFFYLGSNEREPARRLRRPHGQGECGGDDQPVLDHARRHRRARIPPPAPRPGSAT